MSTVAAQPFSGAYRPDPVHSSFAFSVHHPGVFDAERHPEITFRSTEVRLAGDGRAEVDGELTIRGVTRPVAEPGLAGRAAAHERTEMWPRTSRR